MKNITLKTQLRNKRKTRVRAKVAGTESRPRITLTRSSVHMFAQVIDDSKGKTLTTVSSFSKGDKQKARAGIAVCTDLGKKLAVACKGLGVTKVVFDKNGYSYHGRVKAFADGAREGGLDF